MFRLLQRTVYRYYTTYTGAPGLPPSAPCLPWQYTYHLFVYTTTHCSFKAYYAILVRRSNFRHQASPRVPPRESTQRRKVELWARNVR